MHIRIRRAIVISISIIGKSIKSSIALASEQHSIIIGANARTRQRRRRSFDFYFGFGRAIYCSQEEDDEHHNHVVRVN
jgi:hypothetical protein